MLCHFFLFIFKFLLFYIPAPSITSASSLLHSNTPAAVAAAVMRNNPYVFPTASTAAQWSTAAAAAGSAHTLPTPFGYMFMPGMSASTLHAATTRNSLKSASGTGTTGAGVEYFPPLPLSAM